MATFDNSYSRMVALLKIALPLIALGILSSLFLVSRNYDTSQSIPFIDGDIQEIAREQKIGSPSYSGVADDGAAYVITADSAIPNFGGDRMMTAKNITALIESRSGTMFKLTAPNGTFDSKNDRAELMNGVILNTSSGFHMETDTVMIILPEFNLTSAGPVSGDGPIGNLEAGKMIITRQKGQDSDNGYLLVFTDGVNLIYTPQQQ